MTKKLILQTKKEASNIYPKQTTNEEKITNAYFHLLFIDFDYFWVIFWRFFDFFE